MKEGASSSDSDRRDDERPLQDESDSFSSSEEEIRFVPSSDEEKESYSFLPLTKRRNHIRPDQIDEECLGQADSDFFSSSDDQSYNV